MKRPLALLLACILLLTTFAGCGKKKPGAKADDTAEYEALYAPVLKKYKQAFEEEWPREKFLETGLAPNLAGLEKTAEPSFAFLDLNNDKTPELFIGRADEAATVYDLYTVDDAQTPVPLIDPTTETVLTLTGDNRLVDEIDDYESLEVTTFYKMDDDSLTPTDSYIHDPDKIIDGMDEWYHATGELPKSESEFYAEDMEVISKDDYDRGATGYTEAKLAMKEFAELVLPDNVEDLDLSPEARAKMLYAPVIEMYREAFAKGLDMGELLEKNYEVNYFGDSPVFMPIRSPDFSICYLFSYGSVDDSGYMFQDLDNDGNPEMITGRTTSDDNSILDLFTIKDGVPVKTIQSFERNLLYLCTDGRIARYNHGGYDTNTMEFYEYKNGALHFVEVYFQDSGECFHATAETVSDRSKQQPITKEALEKAYDIDKVKLTLTPFSAEEPASEPEPTDLSTLGESLYASVLDEYRVKALTIDETFGGYSALSSGTPGYAFTDLDRNGTPELAVCGQWDINEPAAVVELYVIGNNGKPKRLIDAYEISSMDICTDGRVLYEQAGNVFVYFKISNDQLQFDEAYEINYDGPSESYLFVTDGNYINSDGTFNWDWPEATESQKISKTEFEHGTKHDVLALNINPFAVTETGIPMQTAYQSVMQKTKDARTDKGTQLEYAMHDINEDGLEELLILDKYHGFNATGNYRLFMYLDGVVIYLGNIDWDEGSLLDGSKKMYLMSGYADNYGTAVSIVNNELSTSEYNEFSSSDMASFGPPISFTAF